jgi:hypothetical protein
MKPKVVTLCGSSRFVDVMAVCAWILERDEKAITMGLHLLPDWYSVEPIPGHLAEHEGVAKEMDELHFRKINLSDEIYVINCVGYIGSSTRKEIDYALAKGMPIRYFWDFKDHIAEKTLKIMTRELSPESDAISIVAQILAKR